MDKNNIEKSKLGWVIPVNIKDGFTDFCRAKGCHVQEDCAGALIIWQQLPSNVREAARVQAKGIEVNEEDNIFKQWIAEYVQKYLCSADGVVAIADAISKQLKVQKKEGRRATKPVL